MKSLLPLLLVSFIATRSFAAEDAASTNVRIDVQMVTMSLEAGLPLLPRLRDPGGIDGACSQIQKLIEDGGATLLGWPEVVTRSGNRAVTEDVQEVRFATEFADAPTPDAGPQGQKNTLPVPATRGGAPMPTAFETRNVGSTLEVEPVVGPDAKTIDLNVVPQSVQLLSIDTVASGRDVNGHDWKVEQPRFYSAKTTVSLSVRSGQRVLLAAFRDPAGKQIQFFILKAELTAADAAKPR